MVPMAALDRGRLPVPGQVAGSILANRFQQAVTGAEVSGRFGGDHGLVDQAAEEIDDPETVAAGTGQVLTGHGGRRLQVEAGGEDRQSPQEPGLGRGQELVAPVHRRPERPVPGQGRAAPAG